MKDDLMNLVVVTMISAFALKVLFWLLITDVKQRTSLFKSFLRINSIYHLHDAPSKKTKTFLKVSNTLNFIFWISVGVIGLLLLNQLFKATAS